MKEKLVEIYNDLTGESYAMVGKKEPLTEADWSNKGIALYELGKLPEKERKGAEQFTEDFFQEAKDPKSLISILKRECRQLDF